MRWFERFARWSEKRGSTREIWRDEDGVKVLYLKRHYVYRCSLFEIMIHQFYRGDTGELHNHPAFSFGRILKGWYIEQLCKGLNAGYNPFDMYLVRRIPGFFDWSYRPGSDKLHMNYRSYHKVILTSDMIDKGEVYTFFVMGKRNKYGWSFWKNGNPLDFREKFKQDGTAEKQSAPENWGMGWFPKKIMQPC